MDSQTVFIRFISLTSQRELWHFYSFYILLFYWDERVFHSPVGAQFSSACFDWRRNLEAGLTVALAARFRWDRTTGQMRNCFHLETQGEKEGRHDTVTGGKTHTSCLRYIAPVIIIIPTVGGAERTCAQSSCTWLIVDIPQFYFTSLHLAVAFGSLLTWRRKKKKIEEGEGGKKKKVNQAGLMFCFNPGRGLLQGGPCVWSANTQTALIGCWLLVREKKWQR